MAIMIPTSIAPKNGNASRAAEITIARIPTPIRKNRDTPECLSEKPSIILAIPLIRNAIPMSYGLTSFMPLIAIVL